MRLFYAVNVPKFIADEIIPAQKQLRGHWRAVASQHLHVTLLYLPQVQTADVEGLLKRGERTAKQFSSSIATVRGTGYFPNEGSPRVWFAKVDSEVLPLLAEQLHEGLTLPTDDKPFKAHITLARKKGPAPRVPPVTFNIDWKISSFVLMESILKPSGPIYKPLATFRLTPHP